MCSFFVTGETTTIPQNLLSSQSKDMETSSVVVYTDGSCLKNPGPGGWAFLVSSSTNDEFEERSGGEYRTTNNRMELQAVVEALLFLPTVEKMNIYTDSQLVLHCAQGTWQRRANLDLWAQYDLAARGKQLTWHWVRGHSGHPFNERVDKLARKKAIQYQTLYK